MENPSPKTAWQAPEFNPLHPAYWFGLADTRALALFRILFAGWLIKVAVYYYALVDTFFTDTGIVPRSLLTREQRFSLLDALGEGWQVRAFLLLWIFILVNLTLGNYTRLMAVLNFIFIVSVHERNPYILNGADTLMRVMSFWLIFANSAQYYSLDALRERLRLYQRTGNAGDLRAPEGPRLAFALPLRMLQIQLALVYVFTFLLKLEGSEWRDGSAMHYALQVNSLMLPTGEWLLEYAPYPLLQMMTMYAILFEGTFLLFAFFPFFQPMFRSLVLWAGALLHIGIGALMAIQNFSHVMLVSYLPLCLPEWVKKWDDVSRLPGRQALILPPPPAKSPLWLLLALTRSDEIRLGPGGEAWGPGPDDWAIHDEAGQVHQGGEAWRQALAHTPLSRFWLWTLRWAPWRALLWNAAGLALLDGLRPPARDEGPSEGPARWEALVLGGRVFSAVVVLWMMAAVIWWNLYGLEGRRGEDHLVQAPNERVYDILFYSGLWQGWGMFAPFPSKHDGWVVVPGRFENGQELDLMTGAPLSADWTRWYWGPARWEKFSSNMYRQGPRPIMEAWGEHYCYVYNEAGGRERGERLSSLSIVMRYKISYPPGGQAGPLQERVLLGGYSCLRG
jgi:hypothetical protein